MHTKIKEESKDHVIKNIRNLLKLKKGSKTIKDKRISDIRNLFKLENEYCHKTIRVVNSYSDSYIEYKGNDVRNKNLLIEEYLNKIKQCLKIL